MRDDPESGYLTNAVRRLGESVDAQVNRHLGEPGTHYVEELTPVVARRAAAQATELRNQLKTAGAAFLLLATEPFTCATLDRRVVNMNMALKGRRQHDGEGRDGWGLAIRDEHADPKVSENWELLTVEPDGGVRDASEWSWRLALADPSESLEQPSFATCVWFSRNREAIARAILKQFQEVYEDVGQAFDEIERHRLPDGPDGEGLS